MKKYLYLLSLVFLALACQSNRDSNDQDIKKAGNPLIAKFKFLEAPLILERPLDNTDAYNKLKAKGLFDEKAQLSLEEVKTIMPDIGTEEEVYYSGILVKVAHGMNLIVIPAKDPLGGLVFYMQLEDSKANLLGKPLFVFYSTEGAHGGSYCQLEINSDGLTEYIEEEDFLSSDIQKFSTTYSFGANGIVENK